MFVFQTYLTGLVVAHLIWFFFFTTGHLLRQKPAAESDAFSLAELVITSVAGMALWGFGLLLLGFAHVLNRFGIASCLLLEGALFWLLKRDNWFSWMFWRATFKCFLKPWSISTLFVYIVFLVLGMPGVLPPTFADSVTYHLAYAVDWANAGRIYVDPFLRFPYYANNFLLLYSALFILKLGSYCHFLTWLCGLLTCLAVQSFFTPAEKRSQQDPAGKEFYPEQFLIPLCVALSPVFLRFLNVAFINLPIGLFVLTTVLCAYRSSAHEPFEPQLVVTAAFCAGMKLTLIGHLPFFLISLFIAGRRRLRRREIALLSLTLIGLSLPWYVRNLIETGDPTPPIFNLYVKHRDPIFEQADHEIYTSDTITSRQPGHLLLLPFRFFTQPESRNFRERGVSAAILFMYAPSLVLVAQLVPKRQRPSHRLIYLSGAVMYLVFPWLFSSLGRYSLHWYPTLAAWVGVIVSHIYTRTAAICHSRWQIWTARVVAVAFCCALVFPSPTKGCLDFYRDYYSSIPPLSAPRHALELKLKNWNGYEASQAVIATLALNQKTSSRVLTLETGELAFYFRKSRITSVGDEFGPARYLDLYHAVEQGDCRPYLDRLDISAVIAQPTTSVPKTPSDWWPLFYEKFRSQLKMNHFKEYSDGMDQVPIFLRSDLKPVAKLNPVIE
jgi:hypothetical protein